MTSIQRATPVAAPVPTSVRQMLRAATAALHAEVDERFSGSFATDRQAYGAFLVALARAVLPLEAAFEEAGVDRLLTDWSQRRRGAALRQDLHQLGLPVPEPAKPPRVGNDARLFGMLYVLEGSRLGGKLLLRQVLQNPAPDVRAATHYLAHASGRDLWRPFLDRLEASSAVAQAPADAVAGAREAFTLFNAPSVSCQPLA